MEANQTLGEQAAEEIRAVQDALVADQQRVLWWDDGGHLEPVVCAACERLGVEHKVANETPLEVRRSLPTENTVWYLPYNKDAFDWFRDVNAVDGAIDLSIEDLAIRVFPDEQLGTWRLYETTQQTQGATRDDIAAVLRDELATEPLPTLEQLRTNIITGGYADPIAYILRNGWDDLGRDKTTINELRELLIDRGVTPASDAETPTQIVTTVREWAVADWLVAAGLPADDVPSAFQPSPDQHAAQPVLQQVLQNVTHAAELAEDYLGQFWDDILPDRDAVWQLGDCPVDGALEQRLWNTWINRYEQAAYQECQRQANERAEALKTAFGDTPWTLIWEQCADIARVAHRVAEWSDNAESDDVIATYADAETGTWQIDYSVLRLTVSGRPETRLPASHEHPAMDTLPDIREGLITEDYLDYLDELGGLIEEAVTAGAPFAEYPHAHEFWTDEQSQMEQNESIAIFILDALRLDIARALAERLRNHGFSIEEETRIGTIPSETKFGKGALTPGTRHSYRQTIVDNQLIPERAASGRQLTPNTRESILQDNGWYVTRDVEQGWNNPRVVYYSNELDDIGEGELSGYERLLTDRVDQIEQLIIEQLGEENLWDRAYILTDHGFVSLPEGVSIVAEDPPDGATDVARRRVAGTDIDDSGPGVIIDESTQLPYLDEEIQLKAITDPQRRFSKRGLSDSRYYHGGVLPQEFVLNFITITPD